MDERAQAFFVSEVLEDGWVSWNLRDETRYNAFLQPLWVRSEAPTADGRQVARLRMFPERKHSNLGDNIHGATLLGFIDIALFACSHQFGVFGSSGPAMTVDLTTQFVGGGRLGEPLDAVTELVRETGRLVFLRGLLVQGENDSHLVASFAGTIRKPSRPR